MSSTSFFQWHWMHFVLLSNQTLLPLCAVGTLKTHHIQVKSIQQKHLLALKGTFPVINNQNTLSELLLREKVQTKVSTCCEEDVVSGGVPGQDAHPLTVLLQGHRGLSHRTCQAPVWNLPHLWPQTHNRRLLARAHLVSDSSETASANLDGAVLWGTCNYVVIVRTPLDVQHWSFVAVDCGRGLLHSATLREGHLKHNFNTPLQ